MRCNREQRQELPAGDLEHLCVALEPWLSSRAVSRLIIGTRGRCTGSAGGVVGAVHLAGDHGAHSDSAIVVGVQLVG